MESRLNEKIFEHIPLGISGLGGWLILVQIGLYATIIGLVTQIVGIALAKDLEGVSSISDLIRSGITCLIWIPYFMKSERVKTTFVR